MSVLVKESLAVERTIQLLEHGHMMVLRWTVILLDLLDVLDSSLHGSVTLYTAGPYYNGGDVAVQDGNYTCCIDELCTSIRLWQFATVASMLSFGK